MTDDDWANLGMAAHIGLGMDMVGDIPGGGGIGHDVHGRTSG
jgi:hypothetical protein